MDATTLVVAILFWADMILCSIFYVIAKFKNKDVEANARAISDAEAFRNTFLELTSPSEPSVPIAGG